MDYCTGLFTSYLLELSSNMDAYSFLKMKHILLQVDMISTGRYYDDVDIIQWNSSFLTCYIQVMSTRQFLPQMSPSSMFVYTKEYASHQSTYLIMLVPFV